MYWDFVTIFDVLWPQWSKFQVKQYNKYNKTALNNKKKIFFFKKRWQNQKTIIWTK